MEDQNLHTRSRRSLVFVLLNGAVLIYIWFLMGAFLLSYAHAFFEKLQISPPHLYYLDASYHLEGIYYGIIFGCLPVFGRAECLLAFPFSLLLIGFGVALILAYVFWYINKIYNLHKVLVFIWFVVFALTIGALVFDIGNNLYWDHKYRPNISEKLTELGENSDQFVFNLDVDSGLISVWWPTLDSERSINLDLDFNLVTEQEIKTKDWLTYSNGNFGFEIKYPKYSFLTLDKLAILSDGTTGDRLSSVDLQMVSSLDQKQIYEFVNGLLIDIKSADIGMLKEDKNIINKTQKPIVLDGVSAVYYDLDYSDGSEGKSVVFVRRGKEISLDSRYKPSKWGGYYDEIISTFKFIN